MPRGEAGAAFLPEFTPPQEKARKKKFLSMEERTEGLRKEDEQTQTDTASITPLENVAPRLNREAKKERIIRIESQESSPADPQEDLFDDEDPTGEHEPGTWSEARLRAYHEEQRNIQEADLARQEKDAAEALKAVKRREPIRRNGKILTDETVRQEGQEGLEEVNKDLAATPEPKAAKRNKKELVHAQDEADLAAVREMLEMAKEPALIDAAQKRMERAAWVQEQTRAERSAKKRAETPGYNDIATLDFSKIPDNKTKWQPREGFVRPEVPPEEPKVVKKTKSEKFDIPFPLEPQKGMRTKKAKGFEERVIPTEIVKPAKPVEKKGFLSSLADSKLGKWTKRTALALGILAASPASNRGPEHTQARAVATSTTKAELPPELQEFNFEEPEVVEAKKPSFANRVPTAETPKGYIKIQESDLQPADYTVTGKASGGSKAEKAPRGSSTSSSKVEVPNPYDGSIPEKNYSSPLRDPYEESEISEESQSVPEISTKRAYGNTSYERETKAPKEFKAEIKSPRLQSEKMNPFNPRGPEVKKVSRNEYYDGASGSLFKLQGNKLTEIRFDWRGMPRKILIGEQGENGKYTPTDVIPVFEGKAMVNGKPAAESIQEWVQQATELRNKSM